MATLKDRHAKEVQTLQDKLAAQGQQLTDANVGSQHRGTLPESERPNAQSRIGELERKLATALSEKEKVQNARIHLEGMLEELQQEVERLQDLNERQEHAAHSDGNVTALQSQVSKLSQCLTETRKENESLRQRLKTELGDAKNEVSVALLAAKEERDAVMIKMEEMMSTIGDEESQIKTSELLNTMEKENTVLKEQNVKLEEQVLIQERVLSNHMTEKRSLLETLATLHSGLPGAKDESISESDFTPDTYCSSTSLSSDFSLSALQLNDEEIDAEVKQLRSKLEKMMDDSSSFDLERSDWQMEKEALEDIVTDLRKKSQDQEEEIVSLKSSETPTSALSLDQHEGQLESCSQEDLESQVTSLREENQELEKALEELDSQHSDAVAQLIRQRDKMAAQLLEQEKEIDVYRADANSLNATIEEMKNSGKETVTQLEEKCQQYQTELSALKDEHRQGESVDSRVKELKEKLEKGGLVINDLHMDKQDLEHKLQKAKEEIEGKVLKLKESREDKAALEKEMMKMEEKLHEVEERLMESEVELEKWQQLKEDRQTGSTERPGIQDVEMECSRLRLKIEKMEQERKAFKEDFQCLIDGNKDHDDLLSSVKDTAFHHIFEEELKVRQKLEEDENVVQELREYIEKLGGERQTLKDTVTSLTSHKNESESVLMAVTKERDSYKAQMEEKVAEVKDKESEVLNLRNELEQMQRMKVGLEESLTTLRQEKLDLANLYDIREEELKAGREAGEKTHHSLKDMNVELDRLREEIKDVEELRRSMGEKNETVKKLTSDCEMYQNQIKTIKTEIVRLECLCEEKEEELSSVKERMSQFDRDLHEMEESVSVTRHQNQLMMESKDKELRDLESEKKSLETRVIQQQEQVQSSMADQQQMSADLSKMAALKEEEIVRLQTQLQQLKMEKEGSDASFESELAFSREKIASLKDELSQVRELMDSQKAGIGNENRNSLFEEEKIVVDVMQKAESASQNLLTQPMNTNDNNDLTEKNVASSLHMSNSQSSSHEADDVDRHREHFEALEKEMEELREKLSQKDGVVLELQRSNTSLFELLEKKADSNNTIGDRLATHKLELELKSIRAEREQMVAVVSEKSRENSSLKAEIHRLMDVVSAGQTALSKVQQDNVKLEHQQRQSSPPRGDEEDEMKREALNNMARLVRDKDTEIEALTQKNDTLLAVLQESSESGAASHLGPLLKEKEALSQQVATILSEREQLIACVTQKHSESLAFHGEVQRLTAVLIETQEAADKSRVEYSALIPAFERKTQALLSTQQELVECKQKLTELEIRHGELIQKANSLQSSTESAAVGDLEAEVEKYKRLESDYKTMVVERDGQIQSLSQRMKSFEDMASSKEAECAHLKKQLDNSKFQLTGLMAEIAEAKSERELVQQKSESQGEESTSLRNSMNQMRLAVKDKEQEIVSLKEQISTLNTLLQSQKGDQDQVALLMREHEAAATTTRQLQQERDYNAMLADQRQQECETFKIELSNQKDKVFKMTRELERLRSHLIEIEDGYTQEALEAEEREKELRNKLAIAEEQLFSSTSHVQLASQESHRHIESLQEQLQHIAGQRDAAYMQVASTQDQCEQYAASLKNLQLVLEHFQKEKDSAIALETEKYQDQASSLSAKVKDLESELENTRGDLTEALDGLEAASRLSEQLDRKQDALVALKEEVLLREQALNAAEEVIQKLNSSKEAKVDKTLMHNMVLTWLTSPEKKRHEIVQLIGHVLDFSKDDFSKIESAHSQDSLWIGFFKRPKADAAPQPSPDQSFSQLFVKFLERESSPPPTPVKLPVESMAAETQARHKTNFNPFMAPRHVTHGSEASALSSGGSSHLLMPHDTPHPSPLFAPVTNVSSAGESAILKDVLSWKR